MKYMRSKTFPHNAKFNRVMGILGFLHSNSGKLSICRLSTMSNSHVDVLFPQVTAAKMLGLIAVNRSDIVLTDLGEQLRKKSVYAMREVGNKLRSFEPFRSATDLARGSRGFTAEELSEKLAGNKTYWHIEARQNSGMINSILLQWAIHFGLLCYNGKSKRWQGAD